MARDETNRDDNDAQPGELEGQGVGGDEVGTHGYSGSTDEYPSDAPPPSPPSSSPTEVGGGADDDDEPRWPDERLRNIVEQEHWHDRNERRPLRNFDGMTAREIILTPPLPPKPARRAGRGRRANQVNLKLTGKEYEGLLEAAREYSLPPATLARMLVVRGARAALEGPEEAENSEDE